MDMVEDNKKSTFLTAPLTVQQGLSGIFKIPPQSK